VNGVDEIAPPASVEPFIGAMPEGGVHLIEHTGEIGVGLQHLAVLAGRQAHAHVWPEIVSWLQARA
jgi:polyhydroxyalkanoate synthase